MNTRYLGRRFILALLMLIIGVTAAMSWAVWRRPLIEKVEVRPDCFTNSEPGMGQSALDSYFPSGAFSADKYFGERKAEEYPKFLAAMNEPSVLHLPECAEEAYRFLWLRTFHAPVAVRVWRSGNRSFLAAKQLSGKSGYGIGQLIVEKLSPLDESEWLVFTGLVNQTSFWTVPTEGEMLRGHDGAEWLLEGAKNGKYHVVDRWSPEDQKYRAACEYLMKISGLEIDESHYKDY